MPNVTIEELIGETVKIEETLESLIGDNIYDIFLTDYDKNVSIIKKQNCGYLDSKLSKIQQEYNNIERRLPYVSSASFNRYIHLGNLIAVLKK